MTAQDAQRVGLASVWIELPGLLELSLLIFERLRLIMALGSALEASDCNFVVASVA